jgi:CheY-like chemotaxis protein
VEDEKQASELLTFYLEEGGYQVAHAFDGVEAIEKAKKLKPSAITLDIILPKKDGLEVLQELKSLPETKNIPIIIISIVDNKELGLSLGAADYLVKPIDQTELIHRLQSYGLTAKLGKALHILVVDDNPQDVELLTTILEPEGFKVTKAYGGREGINLAIQKSPDAIILDLLMPEVNGFEVVQRLKAHPKAKDIPIFIYTAKNITEEDRRMLSDYVVSIKEKGRCSREELLSDVRKALMKGD